jgi:hypothetical protein
MTISSISESLSARYFREGNHGRVKELEFRLVVVATEFDKASLSCTDGQLRYSSVLPVFILHNHVS